MKVGDWVLNEDGRVGQITLLHSMDRGYHLVNYQDKTFARLTHHKLLTVLEKPVADILTAVKQHESE